MQVKNKTDLAMIRGDTECFLVVCTNQDGTTKPFVDGDTIYFTVKEGLNKVEKILQKVVTTFDNDGAAIIEISPVDTKGLKCREYIYDIQLIEGNGRVATIVRPSAFEIEGDVTDE